MRYLSTLILLLGVTAGFNLPLDKSGPIGSEYFQINSAQNSYEFCSKVDRDGSRRPPHDSKTILGKAYASGTFDMLALSNLSYDSLINLLISIIPGQIQGKFEISEGSLLFYADSNRIIALLEALSEQASLFNSSSDAGIETLIEVIRAGFYLGYYYGNQYTEIKYLNTDFQNRAKAPMEAIGQNPNFSLGTASQDKVVYSWALLMDNTAQLSFELLGDATRILHQFNQNAQTFINSSSKCVACYQIMSGVYRTLYNGWIRFGTVNQSPYYLAIDSFCDEVKALALYGNYAVYYNYVIYDAVYWYRSFGQFQAIEKPVAFFTDVIDLYGKYSPLGVLAAQSLVGYFGGKDANGNIVDLQSLKAEIRNILFPKTMLFDNNAFKVKYAASIPDDKIVRLYYAAKEVNAQFYRFINSDSVLQPGLADDSLTCIIYGTPQEYEDYQYFLSGLSTDNGGIYIEQDGTFYSYDRTPAQSVYTLEELFRHEYTHYCQGRYLVFGNFGDALYSHDRLTWFDEGMAEFLAGSTRENGVLPRLSIFSRIQADGTDKMSIEQVLNSTYNSGFKFYRYAASLFQYLYERRPDLFLALNRCLIERDTTSFDAWIAAMKADISLNQAYLSFTDSMVNRISFFNNPAASSNYLNAVNEPIADSLENDLKNVSMVTDASLQVDTSGTIKRFKFVGYFPINPVDTFPSLWKKQDSLVNCWIAALGQKAWTGYQTITSYFVNLEPDAEGMIKSRIVFEGTWLSPELGTTKTSKTPVDRRLVSFDAYPNPFNSMIRLSFPQDISNMSISFYTISGRMIYSRTLSNQRGYTWNAGNLSSGYYIAKLKAGNKTFEKGIILQR